MATNLCRGSSVACDQVTAEDVCNDLKCMWDAGICRATLTSVCRSVNDARLCSTYGCEWLGTTPRPPTQAAPTPALSTVTPATAMLTTTTLVTSSDASSGIIAGAVVGGLLVLICLIAGLLYVVRERIKARQQAGIVAPGVPMPQVGALPPPENPELAREFAPSAPATEPEFLRANVGW
jgi:hypothetical protein